jgi:hypothetical protein
VIIANATDRVRSVPTVSGVKNSMQFFFPGNKRVGFIDEQCWRVLINDSEHRSWTDIADRECSMAELPDKRKSG